MQRAELRQQAQEGVHAAAASPSCVNNYNYYAVYSAVIRRAIRESLGSVSSRASPSAVNGCVLFQCRLSSQDDDIRIVGGGQILGGGLRDDDIRM